MPEPFPVSRSGQPLATKPIFSSAKDRIEAKNAFVIPVIVGKAWIPQVAFYQQPSLFIS